MAGLYWGLISPRSAVQICLEPYSLKHLLYIALSDFFEIAHFDLFKIPGSGILVDSDKVPPQYSALKDMVQKGFSKLRLLLASR